MIFSLADKDHDLILPELTNTDIFCFFSVGHAVNVPADLWFQAICSSLRLKREVFLLEAQIQNFPTWNARARWDSGENWSWLAPRALSVISRAYQETPMDFQYFKLFLKNSK
jgi:hypothetical protein